MEWIKDILIIIFSGGFGSALAHYLTKKKYNTEVKGAEIMNENAAIQIWKDLVMELESRVNKMDEELNKLRSDVLILHKENIELKKENILLKNEVEKLKSI
jgi:Ser-tRNA(Ala) deacylase AlaX